MLLKIKRKIQISTILFLWATLSLVAQKKQEYFQIKTYTFKTAEQLNTTEKYLENAYLPALKAEKIKKVGVFKEHVKNEGAIPKLVIVIPFTSLFQFEGLENAIANNKKHLKRGEAYLNAAHDNAPYERISSVLLKGFKDMPFLSPSKTEGERSKRVYALRSYESATEAIYANKLEMFNKGGEIKLFKKLDFNAVFYGEVLIGPKMPNLMYMVSFDNAESEKAHWAAFIQSDKWKKLSKDPKYQNNLSHIDNLSLYPTEYSHY